MLRYDSRASRLVMLCYKDKWSGLDLRARLGTSTGAAWLVHRPAVAAACCCCTGHYWWKEAARWNKVGGSAGRTRSLSRHTTLTLTLFWRNGQVTALDLPTHTWPYLKKCSVALEHRVCMLTELIRYKHWYWIVINSGSGLLMVHYSLLWNYDMCSLIAGVHVKVFTDWAITADVLL